MLAICLAMAARSLDDIVSLLAWTTSVRALDSSSLTWLSADSCMFSRFCTEVAFLSYCANLAMERSIVVAEPAERDLALTLDAFDQAVSDAYDKRMPHLIAEHAYRLAQSFSKFYAACPVLVAPDEPTKRSRLALSAAALRQLEIALNLLGIDTPERM